MRPSTTFLKHMKPSFPKTSIIEFRRKWPTGQTFLEKETKDAFIAAGILLQELFTAVFAAMFTRESFGTFMAAV